VKVAYKQWTQFEEFPAFMGGVEEVHQLDDTRHAPPRLRAGGLRREPGRQARIRRRADRADAECFRDFITARRTTSTTGSSWVDRSGVDRSGVTDMHDDAFDDPYE